MLEQMLVSFQWGLHALLSDSPDLCGNTTGNENLISGLLHA